MKRKEKEHLKADPFVHFFEKALAFYKHNRRFIFLGAGAVALVVLILLAVFLFQNLSSTGENKLYAAACRVQTSTDMSVDQKIARLQGMKFRNGISASGRLFLAALLYEKGDLAKAEAVLKEMPKSRVAMINDEKHTLTAQVLAAGGKTAEAEAALESMLTDKKTAMAKELILLQLAKMRIKSQRNEEAASALKRILAEYPDTPSANEAQTLLPAVEGGSPAAR
jgi:predicted negative regulator of RcsB-dependent stress response